MQLKSNFQFKISNLKFPMERSDQRGQYAPLIALMLGTVILPVAGLIMDGAFLYMQKTQLQVMADNAAKAGTFELVKQVTTGACAAQLDCDTVDKKDCACYDSASCTSARVERNQKAKDAAKDYAVKNGYRNATDMIDADVGCYGSINGTNYTSFATTTCNANFGAENGDSDRVINSSLGYDASDTAIDATGNAMKVVLGRDVNHFFAKLIGINSTHVRAMGIARLAPSAMLPALAPFGLLESAFDEIGETNTFWDSNNNAPDTPGYKGLLSFDWRYRGDKDGGNLICDDDDYQYTGPGTGDANDGDPCATGNVPDGHNAGLHDDSDADGVDDDKDGAVDEPGDDEGDQAESAATTALGGRDPGTAYNSACTCNGVASAYNANTNPVIKDTDYSDGITNDGADYNSSDATTNMYTYISSGYPTVPSGYEITTGQRVDVRTGVVTNNVRNSMNTHSCTTGNVFAMPLVEFYQGQGTGSDYLIMGYAVVSVVDQDPASCCVLPETGASNCTVTGGGGVNAQATTMNAIIPGAPGVAFDLDASNGCGNWSYTFPDGTEITAGAYTILLVE